MTRTDQAVFDDAKAGDRAAFAALMVRTAPTVYALLPHEGDRYRQLTDVYVRAMRELFDGADPTDLDSWLTTLVSKTRPRRERRGTTHARFSPSTDLDHLWQDLAGLWPTGRRRRRLSRRTVITVSVVLVMATGALVFAQSQSPRLSADTLRATVYQPDRPDQPELNSRETSSDSPRVPIIPLPPPSSDDPRPALEPTSPDDTGTPEPDDDADIEPPDDNTDDNADNDETPDDATD